MDDQTETTDNTLNIKYTYSLLHWIKINPTKDPSEFHAKYKESTNLDLGAVSKILDLRRANEEKSGIEKEKAVVAKANSFVQGLMNPEVPQETSIAAD
jgi:hypothetical protein